MLFSRSQKKPKANKATLFQTLHCQQKELTKVVKYSGRESFEIRMLFGFFGFFGFWDKQHRNSYHRGVGTKACTCSLFIIHKCVIFV
jgi:hypothetical protein